MLHSRPATGAENGTRPTQLTFVTASVGPVIEPKLAPAMIKPYADLAVSTFMEEFTKAQKRDTQMLPNDSMAQYDIHPEYKQAAQKYIPGILLNTRGIICRNRYQLPLCSAM